MKARRDPEAVAVYRKALLEHMGLDTSDMSDEEVVIKIENLMTALIKSMAQVAREFAKIWQRLMPAMATLGKSLAEINDLIQEGENDEPR